MNKETETHLRDEAGKVIPPLAEMEPEQFSKLLAFGEISVGAAMLLPFVPNRLAGLALGGFSAGLMSVYFKNPPPKTQADGIRP